MDFLQQPKTLRNRIDLDKINYKYYSDINRGTSSFTENFIIFEDGTQALIKKPLSAVPVFSGVYPSGKLKIQQDEYNPLLAKEIANIAGIPCAEYYLAYEDKANYILTPSFLKDGDELILGCDLTDKDELDMDIILKNVRKSLALRKFNSKEIDAIINALVNQCFVSKFIGNVDELSRNFGIILNNRHVRLAPFFDLDYTFNIRDDLEQSRTIDNDPSLRKYIEHFKDFPGFITFVRNFINNLDVNKLFESVQNSTGIVVEDSLKNFYTTYINDNISIVKQTLRDIDIGVHEIE